MLEEALHDDEQRQTAVTTQAAEGGRPNDGEVI